MHVLITIFVFWEWEICILILPPKYAVRKEYFRATSSIVLPRKVLFPFASSFVNCTRKKNHFICVCHLITTHPISMTKH